MRKVLEYICIAACLTLVAYTFYVERQVVAATERVNATTAELRLKAGLEGDRETRPPYHPRIKAELD